MCDTFVLMQNGQTYFAKNSDREPDEPQYVEWHPAKSKPDKKLTYISVERSTQTNAMWISRPKWMWGSEMGVNEHGVCIGNEAVFTHLMSKKGHALLGMDLLRLALEESKTAKEALLTITYYLETYGQGGPAGYKNKRFYYDNSFLIADEKCTWKLETAGRHWVAKKYVHQSKPQKIVISNNLTIESDFDLCSKDLFDQSRELGYWNGNDDFSFKECYATWFMPWAGRAELRKHSNQEKLANVDFTEFVPAQLALILQSHKKGDTHSTNADVCMHATGLFRPSGTTQSLIVHINGVEIKAWATGSPSPCLSLYQPLDKTQSTLIQSHMFWDTCFALQASCKPKSSKWHQLKAVNKKYQQEIWSEINEQAVIDRWWKEIKQLP